MNYNEFLLESLTNTSRSVKDMLVPTKSDKSINYYNNFINNLKNTDTQLYNYYLHNVEYFFKKILSSFGGSGNINSNIDTSKNIINKKNYSFKGTNISEKDLEDLNQFFNNGFNKCRSELEKKTFKTPNESGEYLQDTKTLLSELSAFKYEILDGKPVFRQGRPIKNVDPVETIKEKLKYIQNKYFLNDKVLPEFFTKIPKTLDIIKKLKDANNLELELIPPDENSYKEKLKKLLPNKNYLTLFQGYLKSNYTMENDKVVKRKAPLTTPITSAKKKNPINKQSVSSSDELDGLGLYSQDQFNEKLKELENLCKDNGTVCDIGRYKKKFEECSDNQQISDLLKLLEDEIAIETDISLGSLVTPTTNNNNNGTNNMPDTSDIPKQAANNSASKYRDTFNILVDQLIDSKNYPYGSPEATELEDEWIKKFADANGEEDKEKQVITELQTELNNITNGTTSPNISAPVTPPTNTNNPINNDIESFTTSQGSYYSVDKNGKTLRTKNSNGKGKGKTETEPFSVFYVTRERADGILNEYNLKRSIRLGYEENSKYYTIYDSNDLPKNATPLVLSCDGDKIVKAFKAVKTPEIGLHPIEKLYSDDGHAYLHVGNDIVDIKKYTQSATQPNARNTSANQPNSIPTITGKTFSANNPLSSNLTGTAAANIIMGTVPTKAKCIKNESNNFILDDDYEIVKVSQDGKTFTVKSAAGKDVDFTEDAFYEYFIIADTSPTTAKCIKELIIGINKFENGKSYPITKISQDKKVYTLISEIGDEIEIDDSKFNEHFEEADTQPITSTPTAKSSTQKATQPSTNKQPSTNPITTSNSKNNLGSLECLSDFNSSFGNSSFYFKEGETYPIKNIYKQTSKAGNEYTMYLLDTGNNSTYEISERDVKRYFKLISPNTQSNQPGTMGTNTGSGQLSNVKKELTDKRNEAEKIYKDTELDKTLNSLSRFVGHSDDLNPQVVQEFIWKQVKNKSKGFTSMYDGTPFVNNQLTLSSFCTRITNQSDITKSEKNLFKELSKKYTLTCDGSIVSIDYFKKHANELKPITASNEWAKHSKIDSNESYLQKLSRWKKKFLGESNELTLANSEYSQMKLILESQKYLKELKIKSLKESLDSLDKFNSKFNKLF